MKRIPFLTMFTMSYVLHWQKGILNRNWFIYRALLETGAVDRILLVDFLPYSMRSFMRSLLFRSLVRFRLKKVKGMLFSTLFKISEREYVLIAPIAYFSRERFAKQLKRYLRFLDAEHPWSWSYNPLDITFLNREIFRTTVFDAVDDWRYHSVFKRFLTRLSYNYPVIAKQADYIFTVSDCLARTFTKEWGREHIATIPNAVSNVIEPLQSTRDGVKRVVYLGTIEERFDTTLAHRVARALPDTEFHFIGPIWKGEKKEMKRYLSTLPNVHYHRRIPYTTASAILSSYDAAFIPHHITQFSQSNDPLKIYDFLAAGLPVVSTIPVQDKYLKPFVTVVKTADECTRALLRVLDVSKNGTDPEQYSVVKKSNWHTRIRTLMDIIQRNPSVYG